MDVKEISTEYCLRGFIEVRRSVISHGLHEGGMSPPIVREHACAGPVVAVLPYDPDQDRVVMVRQFRIGAWAAGLPPAPWDIVAGIRDGEESLEQAARRELREETGCDAVRLHPIGNFLTAPHVSSEKLGMLCAQVRAFDGERRCGVEAEGEDILAACLEFGAALDLLKAAELPLWAAMGLQWLECHRSRLRATWRTRAGEESGPGLDGQPASVAAGPS